MKYTISALAATTALLIASGCKDVGDNAPNIKRMEDSVFKAFPGVNRVSIEVKDYADVIVTLGDAQLYNATDEKRNEVAQQIGNMSVHFFDKDNYLDKGRVIFVEEETTMTVKPGSEKTNELNLKDMKSAGK